jgi:hypothetical protein
LRTQLREKIELVQTENPCVGGSIPSCPRASPLDERACDQITDVLIS